MGDRKAMSTPSNRPLRASERKELQRQRLRKQAFYRVGVLLAIIIVASSIDFLFFSQGSTNGDSTPFVITKSVALGAVVNWLAQSVFSWFVFRYTGAKSKHNIVGQMYVGQIIKWIIVIIGFSVIFLTVKSLSAIAVLIGFMAMQIGHFITLSGSH